MAAYATGSVIEGGLSSLFDTLATVTMTVSNTGSIAGKEVAQLYVGFPVSANAPVKQLRGFEKVALEPGQSKTITFPLQRRDLSTWDTTAQNWKLASGKFNIYVSRSSRKAELEGSLNLSVS
jgi:beta-glucosidase